MMLVIDKAAVPVLVIVTDCELLDSLIVVEPNKRLVADSVTGGGTPVPFSVIVCGDPAALSMMVTAAVNGPFVVGAKWPWMVQTTPTARLVPQLLAKTNDDAAVPVTAMLLIDNVAVPVLVMDTN